METMLDAYFKERNTPAAGSPTGLAMVELLKLDSTITFEEARAAVNAIGASTNGQKEVAKNALARLTKAAASTSAMPRSTRVASHESVAERQIVLSPRAQASRAVGASLANGARLEQSAV